MTSPENTRTEPDLVDEIDGAYDPVECHEVREDGGLATCGQPNSEHCEDCGLCPGHHADTCVHTPVESLDQLERIQCDEAGHWELWARRDPDAWYPPGCPHCWLANAYEAHAGCRHSHHRAWRRWKISSRLATWAYSLGLIAGYGHTYDGHCRGCLDGFVLRPRHGRPYVLGWPAWKWGCVLKNRHWPGQYLALGCCTKCMPCPACGSTESDHDVFHEDRSPAIASSLGLETEPRD